MGMLKEFRDFAVKGNAVDMAVGIIIGGAFGKIVIVAGQRRHHAADRDAAGQSRIFPTSRSRFRQSRARRPP